MADGAALPAIRTTCPYCGVGCGVAGAATGGRALAVVGDAAHPANQGRLCSKGTALGSTVGLEGRLLKPMVNGRTASWDAAIGAVAEGFSRTIAEHGPDAVAFYLSGQLLTEDYYVANKLMKGFIGSGNVDTNSRLCMASAVAAHKQAFGADLVPGCYEDLELADLVVFSGHNAAWTHPVLFRRMETARARGQRWIVIDPRRTDTAEGADLFLAIAPQMDVRLWNGLLAWLDDRGGVDRAFVRDHVEGFERTLAALAADDQAVAAVAADCGLEREAVEAFYREFAETERTVTLFSQGSNQSTQGVAKGLAVINAHLATGRIGKPGACPFSITGQPNAMGGRETGGMATTLAAHMDFTEADRDRLGRFWATPKLAAGPGLKAVEMFEAVHDGRIKAIWIMATNPAVSLPRASRVREALAACPLVVVSDCMAQTDTLDFAHVKLPALAWGEKDGTVTNSERRISRQRALFPAPGEARADWRIVADVAKALGFAQGFNWTSQGEVFAEFAALTRFENEGTRFLDLGPLADLDAAGYDAMDPVQWPVRADGGVARLFADGRFQTPDGRARMIPTLAAGPARAVDAEFPFSLNTGRVRDHWHTLTRTGLAPELCRHAPEPTVEVHPDDAAALDLVDGALAVVETRSGRAVATARVTDRQRRGGVFLPMHWTDAYAPSGRCNPLIEADVDPVSGQPEFKHAPARLRPYGETWRGFFVARDAWTAPDGFELIWRRTPFEGCQVHEFAGLGGAEERAAVTAALMAGASGEILSMDDAARGGLRRAAIAEGRVERVLVAQAGGGRLPARSWIAERFLDEALGPMDRALLLAGRSAEARDEGPVVCACFKVGARRIEAAVAEGAGSLDAVGAATGAGTNCGSCRPEIAQLVKAGQRQEETIDAS